MGPTWVKIPIWTHMGPIWASCPDSAHMGPICPYVLGCSCYGYKLVLHTGKRHKISEVKIRADNSKYENDKCSKIHLFGDPMF